ncbi:MAG: gamma-glutamyltransferase, partial [Longimicrobiales bacterium]
MTVVASRRPRRALPLLLATSLIATSCAPASRGTNVPAGADHTGRAARAVVVSANQIASDIGADVLRRGGNAVDAAIATGLALAVVHPTAGNIGGGGFMVIRFPDGRTTALDFREKAPLRAHPEMFVDPATGEYSSRLHHNSHRAVGVPGTVAGFDYAHQKYGSGDWAALVQPAVALAEEGFPLSENLARSFANVLRSMQDYPASIAAFSDAGTPYRA